MPLKWHFPVSAVVAQILTLLYATAACLQNSFTDHSGCSFLCEVAFQKHTMRAGDASVSYPLALYCLYRRACKPSEAQKTSLVMPAVSNVTRFQQDLQKSDGWSQLFCHPTNKKCCCNIHWVRERIRFADRKGIQRTKGFMPWRIVSNISNELREWTCCNALSVPQLSTDISESQFNSSEKKKKLFFLVFQRDPSTALLMDRLIIIASFPLTAT